MKKVFYSKSNNPKTKNEWNQEGRGMEPKACKYPHQQIANKQASAHLINKRGDNDNGEEGEEEGFL